MNHVPHHIKSLGFCISSRRLLHLSTRRSRGNIFNWILKMKMENNEKHMRIYKMMPYLYGWRYTILKNVIYGWSKLFAPMSSKSFGSFYCGREIGWATMSTHKGVFYYQGVDSSLDTGMTWVGHCGIKTPMYEKYIAKNKCICTNDRLENDLMYLY